MRYVVACATSGVLALLGARASEAYRARVVDAVTGAPIAGAVATIGERTVTSDAEGSFTLAGTADVLRVRAPGYRRQDVPLLGVKDELSPIVLAPFRPKALYLSANGVGHAGLRQAALALIARTELNALVIDVKGDAGQTSYVTSVALAAQVGAQGRRSIADPDAFLRTLREQGIYTIARIVVFKDDPLALGRPDLAVRAHDGSIWHDREHLAWTDPFRPEVWDYNVALAVEAASHGFDEIQFDYVRFPDARGLTFSETSTQSSRIAAIGGFLAEARRRLAPFNVFLSADVFGYVCWNLGDTMIGQRLEDLMPLLDYLSPMLYPSSFQFGIPGYRFAVAHPYEIVRCSLDRAQRRAGVPSVRFRPWLQAFKDYGFDRRPFTGPEVRAQIAAAEQFGSDGWMLWNPRNVYTADGLSPEERSVAERP